MKLIRQMILVLISVFAFAFEIQAAQTIPQTVIKKLEVSGIIEIEALHTEEFGGGSTSDVVVATVEPGIAAEFNDWVSGEITLLYEENETDLEVDVATISIAAPDGPWSITAGQYYLPFGTFDTNLVSDPLTLEIAETRETAVQAGLKFGDFGMTIFAFNGDNKKNNGADDKIDNWGTVVSYAKESEQVKFMGSIGYINDIGDSDTIQDALSTNDVLDHVGGLIVSTTLELGAFVIIGEYATATDRFQTSELDFTGVGAEPSATNLELGYNTEIADKPVTFAFAYQTSDEALALELPKTRWLAGFSVELTEHLSFALEIARDKDYSFAEGGTDESATIITGQLALEL